MEEIIGHLEYKLNKGPSQESINHLQSLGFKIIRNNQFLRFHELVIAGPLDLYESTFQTKIKKVSCDRSIGPIIVKENNYDFFSPPVFPSPLDEFFEVIAFPVQPHYF
ncbi:hypothetical protein HYX19_04280 [Candidatus Woesearchaeota archaeon]|nr:hypothetical protein [Candidatus Woesearchaeota archaeon]